MKFFFEGNKENFYRIVYFKDDELYDEWRFIYELRFLWIIVEIFVVVICYFVCGLYMDYWRFIGG